MAKMTQHTEIISYLTKLDERQITIFKRVERIESHLESMNDKVQSQEIKIAKIHTYGTMAVIVTPIIINLIMRML
jgi:hypothetical protein